MSEDIPEDDEMSTEAQLARLRSHGPIEPPRGTVEERGRAWLDSRKSVARDPDEGEGFVDAGRLFDAGLALYYAGGLPKGQSTGWACLNEFYTVAEGQLTVVTGFPGSGKSEWLDALLVNLAEADPRWLFAMYSPENYPTVEHTLKLIEKRARKPFGLGPTDRMTADEYKHAALWVHEHFLWLNPSMKTPPDLLAKASRFANSERRLGVVLDPWNTLEHVRHGNMTETDYISLVLTQVTHITRDTRAHVWLVVHPAKMVRNKEGKRPTVPGPYDISGSAHWYNKPDNIITINRDQQDGGQDVDVLVQKVRFKRTGRVGAVTLKYDKVTGRYFEWGGHDIRDVTTGKTELYLDPERGRVIDQPTNGST